MRPWNQTVYTSFGLHWCKYTRWKHTIEKHADVILVTAMEVLLEINAEKVKYMCLSRQQNAEQNHNIQTSNKSFKSVESSKIWEWR
jgi:hypothetical protein